MHIPCIRVNSHSLRQPIVIAVPSKHDAAISASHSRAADSASVSSTVCRSNVERLMTLSTSAVAVCCCSDSRSSLSSRVFSIAMTAWAAKLRDQFDLLVA